MPTYLLPLIGLRLFYARLWLYTRERWALDAYTRWTEWELTRESR